MRSSLITSQFKVQKSLELQNCKTLLTRGSEKKKRFLYRLVSNPPHSSSLKGKNATSLVNNENLLVYSLKIIGF